MPKAVVVANSVALRQNRSLLSSVSITVWAGHYPGRTMAGKKDHDATKNLPEDEPTQVLPKGTKTGLPEAPGCVPGAREDRQKARLVLFAKAGCQPGFALRRYGSESESAP